MSWQVYLLYIAVMAAVTYLIRMIPLTVFRKKIKSRFIRSFLHYVPYACLAAMTVPAIFYGGDGAWSWGGVAALIAALGVSFLTENLTIVACVACAAVFVTNFILK
ncbi:MAG: AzlD domain-containing protein [Clostridia bacterium]|nr:AzlD domain-containing protein [Clostridia bacterium]